MRNLYTTSSTEFDKIITSNLQRTKKKKVYIAGSFQENIDDVVGKFQNTKRKIEERGHQAFIPDVWSYFYSPDTKSDYLTRVVKDISACDTLFLLSDWYECPVAVFKKNCAELLGIDVECEVSALLANIFSSIHNVLGISAKDMKSKSRKRDYVFARLIFTEIAMNNGAKNREVATALEKDYSSVCYYQKTCRNEAETNMKFFNKLQRVNIHFKNTTK